MSSTINIDEAQAHLAEVIGKLNPGEELIIVDSTGPLATIIRQRPSNLPRQPGSAAHLDHWMAPDFDEPLDDFKEYMY